MVLRGAMQAAKKGKQSVVLPSYATYKLSVLVVFTSHEINLLFSANKDHCKKLHCPKCREQLIIGSTAPINMSTV